MENPLLTEFDLHLLAEGKHYDNYEKLGAQLIEVNGTKGTRFAVWAPNAEAVSVIGDFNGWDRESHPMRNRPEAGLWEVFIPEAGPGALYKYFIRSRSNGYEVEKSDPYAFATEIRPRTASKVWDLSGYEAWQALNIEMWCRIYIDEDTTLLAQAQRRRDNCDGLTASPNAERACHRSAYKA